MDTHAVKYPYSISANCTSCPAVSSSRLPTSPTLFMNHNQIHQTEMKPCKQKQQIMHRREKSLESATKGAETEVAGRPTTVAIGCDRQWVSWDSDNEAQQRYNRLQTLSWIAFHWGRGRSGGVGKLEILEDAGLGGRGPQLQDRLYLCSVPVQHSDHSHSTSRCTSEASARQIGQVRLVFNHLSTHLAWNSWLQGNTRSSCLHSKSLKHTTHSVCSDRWFSELNL